MRSVWFELVEAKGNYWQDGTFMMKSLLFSGNIDCNIKWDIPNILVLNIDQTPLSYVCSGQYTFSFKRSEYVPVKGVDDKRQITATFAVSSIGKFIPI